MAKLSLSKIFELSKALTSEAGAELEEPLTFLSELGEQVLRVLKNQLTFTDNFNCEIKSVNLRHNTAIPIEVGSRRPTTVLALSVRSQRYALGEPVRFFFDNAGKLNVTGSFVDLSARKRWPTLDCSGTGTVVVDMSNPPFYVGDHLLIDSVQGGSYVDQIAQVTARTAESFTVTLAGTGSARQLAASGVLTQPPSRAIDIPLDLLILFG